MRFKICFAMLLVGLAIGLGPVQEARSQMGGGYICGRLELMDAGTRFFPMFKPYGTENNPQSWWQVDYVEENLQIVQTGQTINIFELLDKNVRLWMPEFNEFNVLFSVANYEIVDSCEPVIDFYADSTQLNAGECTVIRWNVDASGLNGVYLGNEQVSPGGEIQVCPAVTGEYSLLIATSAGDFSQNLTINVTQPTNTPLPTAPPPPTNTPLPVPTQTPEPTQAPLPWWAALLPEPAPVEAWSLDCHPQCIEYARARRPDSYFWASGGTSVEWLNAALPGIEYVGSDGIRYRIRVRSDTENPIPGDIVIWKQECGVSEIGHIGIVNSYKNGVFLVDDSNWGVENCKERIADPRKLNRSCMFFITAPEKLGSTAGSKAPSTPVPLNPVRPEPKITIKPTQASIPVVSKVQTWFCSTFKLFCSGK